MTEEIIVAMTRNEGFTLIEVLVALTILSIGVLGVAGMQLTGLQDTNTAESTQEASWLAQDAIGRMEANLPAAKAGAYDVALGQAASGSGFAQQDVTQWEANIASQLPAGEGSIQYNAATGIATILIQWGANASANNGNQFQYSAQL